MRYFAYGSNLNLRHLQSWIAERGVGVDGVRDPLRAILDGFRLRTNYYSTGHDAGACNIERDSGDRVEGILLRVSASALEALRIKEGCPHHYVETNLHVFVPEVEGFVGAVTFVVHADRRLEYDLPVAEKYRQIVLGGAKAAGLTPKYQNRLKRILTTSSKMPHGTRIAKLGA